MQACGVPRLLVVDADRRPVGIVSLDDLLAGCASDIAGLAAAVMAGMENEVAETAPKPESRHEALRIPAMGTSGWQPVGSVPAWVEIDRAFDRG
jgi:hypothetical protein